MSALNACPQPLQKVLAETPKDQPIVMLDPKRFADHKRQSSYPERTAPPPVQTDIQKAADCVKTVGAEVVWWGSGCEALIAPPDDPSDQVVLVRYPSIAAYMAMIEQPAL
ncbi:DUF1330 domain-containing protein [Marinobacter sp. F4216]|uniref:DUF1330 domain-containing protein n=1 Tax=Marinobacter sp. F4216 TaxID=2874281 RepID=UPI001CC1337E|nr:DUF1330 domain-containing protein [Marinobacter sp. F4216]MBZ2168198.1 DUF1330 domain-containing protein [Marinobacter sp. F4216]